MTQDVGIVWVLWCHSHLVSLAFILKTLCDLFLLLFCLYCCVGIVREKRGGMPSGRKNFEVENFLANFAVLWLFTKVFSAKFVVARQKPEGFLRENRIFHQFAKVFSIESFPLYGRTFCLHKTFTIISNASKWNCKAKHHTSLSRAYKSPLTCGVPFTEKLCRLSPQRSHSIES